jgi:hypothetical protein
MPTQQVLMCQRCQRLLDFSAIECYCGGIKFIEVQIDLAQIPRLDKEPSHRRKYGTSLRMDKRQV